MLRSRCAKIDELAKSLDRVVASCDVPQRLSRDPVGIVRRFDHPLEQELVGLLASSLAFGNVTMLRASIERALSSIGPDLLEACADRRSLLARLRGFQHRMVKGIDIGRLLWSARTMQQRHGSLGTRFLEHLGPRGDLRTGLCGWVEELRSGAGFGTADDALRRGASHVLSDPSGNSGCKRLMLYLRWMVRRDDGVDLGVWSEVAPRVLLVPVDTHIHRLGVNLGMTSQRAPSWRASEEITEVLREIDPGDPVRFDFALCHLGMLQHCPSERDGQRCAGCGVQAVCRHWSIPLAVSKQKRPKRSLSALQRRGSHEHSDERRY